MNEQIERDIQEIDELTARLERGTDVDDGPLMQRMVGLCSKLSRWQWCIHGDTMEFRRRVTRWLVNKGKYTLAKRYALCGKGDLLLKHDKTGVSRIRPMGCGARFCPRCSRRAGRKHLSRVASHLSTSSHGCIYHIVLTQPTMPQERIQDARLRFETAWKRFYPTLRKAGLRAALLTYHVKPSMKYGWHYHAHAVVEFDDVVDEDSLYDKLDLKWRVVTRMSKDQGVEKELFMRLVTAGGPALVGMKENTQLDFWDEPTDQVECVLHYVIRDVLQGIEGWVEAMDREQDCYDFCDFMGAMKRHRTYGTWRKCVPHDDTEERDEKEDTCQTSSPADKVKGSATEWTLVSTMDHALHSLSVGDKRYWEAMTQFIGCTNRSQGSLFRLKKLVRSIAA